MTYDFSALQQGLTGAKEWLSREYQGLRTGRATPAILDNVQVNAYGSMMPIKQVATVGVEDARTLRVSPFDQSLTKDIERGIMEADLGLGITADSSSIRVSFPELTGERRAEFVKIAKAKLEEARTAVRIARDECWKDIQEVEKGGDMSEDEKFRAKDDMQKKVDAMNDELERLFAKKEAEMQN
jgi:ribosome recycling factor